MSASSALPAPTHCGALDLPRFVGERFAHVAGLALKQDGALEVERSMLPDRIMEPVDVSCDGIFRVALRLPGHWPGQLRLDGLEEGFDHRVVVAAALSAH